jgi:translation initiation factor 2 alpha subunit (eIF-2alpha)
MFKLTNSIFEKQIMIDGGLSLLIVEAVNTLMSAKSDSLTGKEVYSILKISKDLNAKLKDYQDVKTKFMEEFGTKNEEFGAKNKEGVLYEFKDDNKEKFIEKMKELSEIEIEIEGNPIKYNEGFNLNANEMGVLEETGILDLSGM